MNVMVIGGGGREHAVIKKIKENPDVGTVYALPGNGGIAADAVCVPIKATDLSGIISFALEKGIDFAVVTPDDPLVMGLVDMLEEAGVPCFGPRKNAAVIEGSKAFAKEFMKRRGIPTAECRIFSDAGEALSYAESVALPTVVKADGLALGKGVTVAFDRESAVTAVREAMVDGKFGKSGETVVFEEFLTGPEVSVLAFTDGETVVPMVSSMDHKRAYDGDLGPNTGGMGTIAPNPFYTPEIAERCMREIFLPTVRGLREEGRTFRGCLYFGLMITSAGPKVIEYNCRFGDPETQVVLPLLKTDLLDIMRAVRDGRLSEIDVEFSRDSAACVVMASEGYPLGYQKGFEIDIPGDIGCDVFVAGAALSDGRLVTSGGRVLGVTCVAPDLRSALEGAYRSVGRIKFKNSFFRRDVGKRALEALGRD
ncbi:MAG: phosphoribosylamine--glycine ligase [Clostridia bacterium]|nr:phosphoribosylamine--glycine ligase [Clostridia bacterium]